MNESIDLARPSYSAPHHNPREAREQPIGQDVFSRRINPAASYDEDRWAHHLNNRVPTRPPGELRAVDE